MDRLFQLPELCTLTGEKLAGDESIEDLLTLSLCNSCLSGSGKCGTGS